MRWAGKWAEKGWDGKGCWWSKIAWWCRQKEIGWVFWADPECGRCRGGKYQCSWQLADAVVFLDLNERAISLKEVGEAVNKMKSGQAQLISDGMFEERWNDSVGMAS